MEPLAIRPQPLALERVARRRHAVLQEGGDCRPASRTIHRRGGILAVPARFPADGVRVAIVPGASHRVERRLTASFGRGTVRRDYFLQMYTWRRNPSALALPRDARRETHNEVVTSNYERS